MNNFYLAHNKKDVYHYGTLQKEQLVSTGQPYLDYFETEQDLKDRLIELGQEYVNNNPIINQIEI